MFNYDYAIMDLPFRGSNCEFGPLLRNTGRRAVRVKPQEFRRVFPQGAKLIILAGSRKTVFDYQYLCATGGAQIILEHLSAGRPLFAICGGFQMLGQRLCDPLLSQGDKTLQQGLGLLPMTTVFGPEMMSCSTEAASAQLGVRVFGEEHRRGVSYSKTGWDCRTLHETVQRRPLKDQFPQACQVQVGDEHVLWAPGREQTDGLVTRDGKVWGTYIHRIFENEDFNRKFLRTCVPL